MANGEDPNPDPIYDRKTGKPIAKGEPLPAPVAPKKERDYSGYAGATGGIEDTAHPIEFLKNLLSGAIRGTGGLAGIPGSIQEGATTGITYGGPADIGFMPEGIPAVDRYLMPAGTTTAPPPPPAMHKVSREERDRQIAETKAASPLPQLPTVSDTMEWTRRNIPGANVQPTGEGGQLAAGQLGAGMGELIPGAVAPGQLGIRGVQLGTRAATAGLDLATQAALPTAAAHVATDLAKGTDWEEAAGPLAAGATSLAGGAATPPRGTVRSPIPGEPGYHETAVRNINRAIRDDTSQAFPPGHEPTPQERTAQVQRELEQVGEGGRLMDVGPNLGGQAQVLAAGPGGAQSNILRTVRERSQERGNRVGAALDDALGPSEDFDLVNNQLLRERRQNANDLYAQAKSAGPGSQNVDTTPVADAVRQRVHESVLTDEAHATDTDRALLRISRQVANRRDVAGLHDIKVSIDDQIADAAKRAQKGEATGDLATKLIDVRDALVRQLDAATEVAPGDSLYRRARETYRGDSAVLNAREEGAKVFDRDVRPAQLRREVNALTAEERHGYVSAAREKLATMMDNSTTDAGEVLRELNKPGVQEKLQVLVGNDATQRLLTFARGEQRKQATNRAITSQSATYGRTEAGKEFPSEVSVEKPLLMPGQIPHAVARWVADRGRQLLQAGQNNAIRTDAGRILAAPQANQAALLQMLQENYGAGGIGPRLARTLPQAGYAAGVRDISEREPGGQRW